ncbi:PepSY domain-containing protein [Lentibacillus salicampi]|uniref:PepSY domain-containing protein n=1 Tax=Lentibacillus salicampi TaxID=175306 RepID=A0A4Y9ACG3_9BACI|nr:PepSY domain-containing protein [Lentibacillus salicampi]TFJ92074.1 hypothetical protein E4U82_14395 [Lentibacillus salicampi]
MKRKVGIVLAVILSISAMGLGMLQSSASEVSPKLGEQEIRELMTSQYPGDITELELEQSGNRAVYEAEIHDNGTEYEIKMDGDTGEVLELEKKFSGKHNNEQNSVEDQKKSGETDANKNDTKQNDDKKARNDADGGDKSDSNKDNTDQMELNQSGNSAHNKPSKSAVISTGEAEKIAQGAFSGTIVEMELDEDDNRLYYEIGMISKNKEADIEIDAYTGDILVMEIDSDNDDDNHDDNENEDENDHDQDDSDDDKDDEK